MFQKDFLLMLGLAAVAMGLTAGDFSQPGNPSRTQAPGFYRGKLGKFEIVALSDGTAPRHLDEILSDKTTVVEELKASHEEEPIQLSINAFLINTGAHIVLVDTGAGELFGPASGLLIKNLAAAGYQPEQIDTILLTHIHGDHSGGLAVQGKKQFPGATVYVDGHDVALWLSKSEEEKAPPAKRKTFQQSQQTVGPYLAAKQIVELKRNSEILPGITAQSAFGHTPGHTAFIIESEGHRLLLWGDIIHSAEVQFPHPEVTVEYDVLPSEAMKTRMAFLESVAGDGSLMGSSHISFPGFGHVRKAGSGYAWVPLPYSSQVTELDPH